MKTRRQQRYKILRDAGFLPFEARPLSQVPIRTVPYMRDMIRDRQQLFNRAVKAKTSKWKWRDQIKELYAADEFMKLDWKDRLVPDPWQFLRSEEDKFKAKNPAYESPWEKRRRGWRDFLERIEKTIEGQRDWADGYTEDLEEV